MEPHIAPRQALEYAYPPHVLREIINQHADRSPEVVMQQLLDNMYPQDVQQALFGTTDKSHVGSKCASGSAPHRSTAVRRHNSATIASSSPRSAQEGAREADNEATAALRQGWAMQFPASTERAFGLWMTQAQTKNDEFAAAVFVMLASAAYALVAKYLAPVHGFAALVQLIPSLLITWALGAAVPLAQRVAPGWYATHREPLLVALRAANVLQVLAHKRIFPWAHQTGTLPLALLISTGALPLAAPALRHRVRFALHIRVHTALALACAVSVLSNAHGDVMRAQQGLLSVLLAWALPTGVVYTIENNARRAFSHSFRVRLTAVQRKGKSLLSAASL